jgi:hypothetical protein
VSRVISPSHGQPIAPPEGRLIDLLFGLSVALLFTNFEINVETEWVTIRFYPTIPIMAGTTLIGLMGFGRETAMARIASLSLLAFVAVHAGSALSLRFDNGIRELAQATIVFLFVTTFAARYATHPIHQFFKAFWPFALVILGYTIWWHVSQGLYYQWKRLDEPKALFDLLPLFAAAWIWTRPRFPIVLGTTALVLAGVLILLSGERKAYIAFLLALLLLLKPKHPITYLAPLIAVAGIYVAVELANSPYVERQVKTILAMVGIGPPPDSISSVQRAWQLHVGMILFHGAPIFGVGTNGFGEITQSSYYSDPNAYVGVHGEFLRILVENGVVGLATYSSMLLVALAKLLRPPPGLFPSSREYRMALLWFLSLLFYTSFEGANQLLMVLQYSLVYVPILNFGPAWRPPQTLSAPISVARPLSGAPRPIEATTPS